MLDNIPPEVGQVAPGAVGSAVVLKWLPGGWRTLLFSWISGTAVSYYASPALAELFTIESAGKVQGLRLLVGAVGILILAKAVEVIQAANGREIWDAVLKWVKIKLGVQS